VNVYVQYVGVPEFTRENIYRTWAEQKAAGGTIGRGKGYVLIGWLYDSDHSQSTRTLLVQHQVNTVVYHLGWEYLLLYIFISTITSLPPGLCSPIHVCCV